MISRATRLRWVERLQAEDDCDGCGSKIASGSPCVRATCEHEDSFHVYCLPCCRWFAEQAGYIEPDHLIRLSQDLRDESLHLKVTPRRLLELIEIDDGDHDGTPD